jgi:hypothetical protein
VEPVAARDDVADELVALAPVAVPDARRVRLELVERDVVHLEEQRRARGDPRLDQVLHDLRLAVDDDRLPGQLVEGDPLSLTRRLELDARVHEPLAPQPLADAHLLEELRDVVLEHARTDPRLHVLAAAVLEDHALDPGALEQVRERQSRGARADDADLGARHLGRRLMRCAPRARGRRRNARS